MGEECSPKTGRLAAAGALAPGYFTNTGMT